MKHIIYVILVLLVAGVVRADGRLSSEDFASVDTLRFGPDNVTRDALRSRALTPYPFNRVLELPSGTEIVSEPFHLGPTARGRIEDVVWLRLSEAPEEGPGRRTGLTVVGFEGGGPEVRVLRTTTRPTATLEWFDGAVWQQSGATLALNREYRLRTVIDLDLGRLDIHVREEPDGQEWPLTQGRTFRAFADTLVRRRFALGRPSAMKAALAAWQIWRVGQNELIGQGPARSGEKTPPADVVMRYAAPAELTGDAVRVETAGGTSTYTLAGARGLCDDMELPDISRWSPPTRVQRQNRLRYSGKWALGVSEGGRPVDTHVTLPHGDFDLRLRFLVPKSLPANRQVYLVRFKNTATGSEPVGPSLYLDYGAGADGRSLVICQLRPDSYYAQEVDVQPDRWYGLRLVTQRARSTYLGWFVNDDGTEVPLNQGQPLSFFLGTSIDDDVQWRFFSIVSMRTGVSGWPKIDLETARRRVKVIVPEKAKKDLTGLVLRGVTAEGVKDVDLSDLSKAWNTLSSRSEIISKDWPGLRVDEADAAKFEKYKVLFVQGNLYAPWADVRLAYSTSGRMQCYLWYLWYAPGEAAAPDAFRECRQVAEKPQPLPEGPFGVIMILLPDAAGKFRGELRWVLPSSEPDTPQPIPPELFTGKDVVVTHPGSPFPVAGAAVMADRTCVAAANVALEVYDRDWLRTTYTPRFFEKITGSYYNSVSGFTWDPWAECFWVFSTNARKVVKLDRNLAPTDLSALVYYVDAVSVAAGPDAVYFVSKEGKVVRFDKFFATRRGLPMQKMFGGEPLVGALVCVDRFLYLAVRADSPIHPGQLICVDSHDWNPVFSVDLREKFPHVAALASDGKRMYLFDDADADVVSFKLPPPAELEPQDTFVYLDDLALKPVKAPQDVTLIPDPSGGTAGWTPAPAFQKNDSGAWVLPRGRTIVSYDKDNIAYIGKGEARYAWLKLRTQEPQGDSYLYIDLNTSDSRVSRRVVIHYRSRLKLMEEKPELFGKTYTIKEFFSRRELSPLWALYSGWSRYIDGPVRDEAVTAVRILPLGKGFTEHVFSLEKHFDVREGQTVSGVTLSHYPYGVSVPIVTLGLSASEWIPREDASGTVTSQVMPVDRARRRLAFLSWEQVPYDPAAGRMELYVRTAAEKYFIDRESWTPVTNAARLDMPLGGYIQWRLEMSTTDPWRTPGVSNLLFGFATSEVALTPTRADPRSWWLLLFVPAAALLAWLLVGRRSLWERRPKT